MDAHGPRKRSLLIAACIGTASLLGMSGAAVAGEDWGGEDVRGQEWHGEEDWNGGHGDHRGKDDKGKDERAHESRIPRGFEIAPVPLDLKGKNRALVGLGSYLVNAAGGCNDCHTNPPYAAGGNPFLGEKKIINTQNYLAGGTPFGPNLVSANITPDDTGRPAGLSLEEFVSAIRTGVDPDDSHILQVMPWPVYQDLIDRDLEAIYEYLSAIPHAEPGQP
jgi:hypothetical protein